MTFSEVLKNLRRDAKISQRVLADRVGVDFSYISKVENGHLPPPAANTVVKICEVLSVSPEQLLSLSGKLPTEVHEAVGGSPAAQQFMRSAQQLAITETEWLQLGQEMRRLRE